MSHKMAALKIFCEITQKSSFNGQYSWRCRIISGNWNPLKNHEKYFLFHLNQTNWRFYWQIRLCTYYEFLLKQISDIREVWKYWPLKDCFRSISQNFYRATILWWVDQKTSNFQQTIHLRAAFKILYCRVYCYFVV